MSWWDVVYGKILVGDKFLTPGYGIDGGNKRKPFKVIKKLTDKIDILSGDYSIPISKECFDIIERAFANDPTLWLRVAAIKECRALPGSADELIKKGTGSNLARANYICSMLEYYGLVRYTMNGKRKVIVLPR